jgi:hypothetical protein
VKISPKKVYGRNGFVKSIPVEGVLVVGQDLAFVEVPADVRLREGFDLAFQVQFVPLLTIDTNLNCLHNTLITYWKFSGFFIIRIKITMNRYQCDKFGSKIGKIIF